jgi:hypothetical protein
MGLVEEQETYHHPDLLKEYDSSVLKAQTSFIYMLLLNLKRVTT